MSVAFHAKMSVSETRATFLFNRNTIQKVAGTLRVPSAKPRKHCSACGCGTWNVPPTLNN